MKIASIYKVSAIAGGLTVAEILDATRMLHIFPSEIGQFLISPISVLTFEFFPTSEIVPVVLLLLYNELIALIYLRVSCCVPSKAKKIVSLSVLSVFLLLVHLVAFFYLSERFARMFDRII